MDQNRRSLPGEAHQAAHACNEVLSILSDVNTNRRNCPSSLDILLVGFGNFGQFIAKYLRKFHTLHCSNREDTSAEAALLGCEYTTLDDLYKMSSINCDVILVSVSIISFEEVLSKIPKEMLKGKLVVDVLSVKMHARDTMLALLPPECDILCTHPMFGPESGKFGWQGLRFMFDKVRISDEDRCESFLSVFYQEGCEVIEMSCDEHDLLSANSQFITHLIGRSLAAMDLKSTLIDTQGFGILLELVRNTTNNSYDLFYGLLEYNIHSKSIIRKLKEGIEKVENHLEKKQIEISSVSSLEPMS
jgi:arogenate dehydrogenase (NADP+)